MRWSEYTNRILAEIDNEAFFMNELKNIQRRGQEVKAECPFKELHESQTDNNPSLTVNLAKGVYYCNSCHSKGNIHTMYKHLYGLSNEEAWFQLGDALKIPRPDGTKPTRPDIDVGLIQEYHQKLMSLTGPIRDMLKERRGLTDETLKRFQLGWDGERITIPIYDEFNTLVNFRRYKWNSTDDQWKVLNYVDEYNNSYGEVRIFGIDQVVGLVDHALDRAVQDGGPAGQFADKGHVLDSRLVSNLLDGIKIQRTHQHVKAAARGNLCAFHAARLGVVHDLEEGGLAGRLHALDQINHLILGDADFLEAPVLRLGVFRSLKHLDGVGDGAVMVGKHMVKSATGSASRPKVQKTGMPSSVAASTSTLARAPPRMEKIAFKWVFSKTLRVTGS